ncbi:MAG: 1-deoxy-D-xylulose 5-phosphate reductoisomerase [Alphaproteobacteria bacterium MarineAlpha9_Bin5]|nr:MAG: 1-deoxy-D-xylulose 5-phosphate reductoisomerase [Alphaproteobacteria bacterium MarineAlpha9_Bin6]PPR38986.1 MAG: 1-deoxy-D-xylulose 5-phosphate reductoisomerase [Alphaproteobacteria bacterium MarineAlpha9_Bin5]
MVAIQSFRSKEMEPRRVTVLGSTGSVGCNTVSMLESESGQYQVEALTARSNVKLLAEQARRLKPKMVVLSDKSFYRDLKRELAGSGVEVLAGAEALVEAASLNADWVMAAIVGTAGLAPTLAAIRHGAVVALANKECLVSAGVLLTKEVKKFGSDLLPVDSEHNGIFQVFDFNHPEGVEKIILTASGGPFRCFNRQQMRDVTPEEAVVHPNWEMGKKISIDCATMMNKGLERIEAFHLFPIEQKQIEILIHPQSVVHSMVAYCDGSVLAQLGTPDMRMPIAFTLAWPKRISVPVARLDLAEIGQLTFEHPNETLFPALRLAREVLEEGGSAPAVMSAANEIAVEGFLERRIGFLEIIELVERTLCKIPPLKVETIEEVSEVDSEARRLAKDLITG